MARKLTFGADTVTLLTNTSKMPGKSWSLPAHKACPGAITAVRESDGAKAICGSCYASKGMYVWACVEHAQDVRFRWTRECMQSEDGRAEFVRVMTDAIRSLRADANGRYYFRVHDSGDLFNPWYVDCWTRIAQNLPHVRFWIPTRMWHHFRENETWRVALDTLAAQPNVTLRPSALYFGDEPPVVPGWAAGTSASSHAKPEYNCPAPDQGGECRDCRSCWDEPEIAKIYRAH